ncbi:protein fantom-like isoform X4 [Solea solea]|uniref:protein fantom-like isoform X4 n=1 Tax=Solea solea TaxID=90069 RepID=UPI00272B8D6B|nr:protein fantom-like isoform X4 [Solea solea]
MSGQPDTAAETAADDVSRLEGVLQDMSVHQHARARPDVSQMSREELEDRFLRLYEESLLFKQHVNKQEDKIKKLGTKLMKLVKDRGRMEQLAAGGAQAVSRARNVEMEMMLEELQEKVRGLQTENEGLKQRLLVAKQQLMNSQSGRLRQYKRVQPRVNSGLKRRDDSPSPSHTRPGLLEEARARTRNLENIIESQQSHMEEMEAELEQLREELRATQAEYEDRLQQAQQINKLRSHVNNNVTQIKLQKQLTEKSNAVTVLEGQLQEHKQTLKAAIQKLDELSEQLKHEKLKSGDLENRLHVYNNKLELLPQQLSAVEQERDQLKENYNKLLDSIFDVSQQQKWQSQEQQLKLQIVQLETALKADLDDKNLILQKLKAERETHEKLAEENKKLHSQFLEQKQEMDELRDGLKLHSRESEPRKERRDLSFLEQVEEKGSVQELQAAHAETILELEKTRHLLSTENKISNDYKAELEAVQQKMEIDRASYEQKLERQTQLLDASMAKIKKLEAQLRELAYSPKTHIYRPDVADEVESDESDEAIHLEPGQNLVELQIVSASLSPSLLEALGDDEPYTFCTYCFYLSKLHSTPVVTGHRPSYGYTSKYVVSADRRFRDYLGRESVTVELHQALGTDWRTLASGRLPLQQLLKQDEKVHGKIQLVGAELGTVGSLDYWMRVSNPTTEPSHGLRDEDLKKPGGFISSAVNTQAQVPAQVPAQALPPLPKLKQETQARDAVFAKKVKFVSPTPAAELVQDTRRSGLRDQTSAPVMKVLTPAPAKKEDDEDESLVSAGQLVPNVCQSDSDVSEEISEDVEAATQHRRESTQSDSDDCIVHGQAAGRKASERVRVEVVSLSLRAESRVVRDANVVRLFVEYSLLDLPTEETPLSLPKPAQGRSINFNYSKVIPVDAENNAARRRLLRDVLRGRRPQMERIRFTVVSEPPEEEEQDRECEDMGVAFLRIPEILERRKDLMETRLNVVDVLDSSEVVGSLTVSVEGLEALQAIMGDQDLDQEAASASFLLPSTRREETRTHMNMREHT